jgi:L-aspartate oxidase
MRERETEVLVIGTGIAGCTAAWELAEKGIPVTMVTKATDPYESNTKYAQGGINGLGDKDDSPQLLEADTLKAGAGYVGEVAADILANEAQPYINFLEDRGVVFDAEKTREGGHSVFRTNKVADHTGDAIETTLINSISQHPNINLLTGSLAVDLLTPQHHSTDHQDLYAGPSCVGAYIYDEKTGEVSPYVARKTILATGGAGQVYEHTSNPQGATGDGVAMASRAGVLVNNLEFVQFHPTTFYGTGAPRFLITEAARGEGARLVNANGEPFMQNYDHEYMDRATRDIVSRAINSEMIKLGTPCVYLDLRSFMTEEKIEEHFPTIRETLLGYGVDITKDLIPVVPAAHFMCGGIWTDAKSGKTTLDNLYAAGEVAINGGIHGANRLASNSLAAGGIWGRRVAEDIADTLQTSDKFSESKIKPWEFRQAEKADLASMQLDKEIIQKLMWTHVGLVRTDEGLAQARIRLGQMERIVEDRYQRGPISEALIILRNIARMAPLITEAAWADKESAGCHYRE